MSNPPPVKSSTRLWSQEVAAARATTELDAQTPGQAAIAALTPQEVGYEFSNGRKFKDGKGPYA
jgi:hypothetical protein